MADALLYLDYNATTPVDPRVLEAMMPYFRAEAFGNPSSVHSAGRGAATAIARARKQVQELIGAEHADEVVFVSGGTESLNWAVKGVMWAAAQTNAGHRGHVITTAVEHAAVLESCKYLQGHGFSCTVVPVDREGLVDPASIVEAMRPDTVLVTIMHANNEVGTVQPVAEVARAVKARNPAVLVHTDASQSLGKVPANVRAMGVDLLSIAGHKMYAPKAIGALYVRRGVAIEKLVHGAGQESGRRAGTENVPYIVGLGSACSIVASGLDDERAHLAALRDVLCAELRKNVAVAVVVNGPKDPERRLPNTLSVSVAGVRGADVLVAVKDRVAASAGAACHSGDRVHVSHVLRAMGVPQEQAIGTLRLSVGRFTKEEEAVEAAALLGEAINALLRASSA